jgi:hypothetical protein
MGYQVRSANNTYISRKAITIGQDISNWGYKLINHETGHTMCLPDLYPLPTGPTLQYVGNWDLMAYISGTSPDYFAWHKWKLGWIDDLDIDCVATTGSTTHTLSPVEIAGGKKAVVIKYNSTLAFVAEVRSNLGNNPATCSTGVLLYTVSTDVSTGLGPIRVLDSNPGTSPFFCTGNELDDAPLNSERTSSYTSPELGISITILAQNGDGYTIRVDATNAGLSGSVRNSDSIFYDRQFILDA